MFWQIVKFILFFFAAKKMNGELRNDFSPFTIQMNTQLFARQHLTILLFFFRPLLDGYEAFINNNGRRGPADKNGEKKIKIFHDVAESTRNDDDLVVFVVLAPLQPKKNHSQPRRHEGKKTSFNFPRTTIVGQYHPAAT